MAKVKTNHAEIQKSLSKGVHGKIGIVVEDKSSGSKDRTHQVFLTGAFQIMFLSDGGVYDKKDDLFEVRWLNPGETVSLVQE